MNDTHAEQDFWDVNCDVVANSDWNISLEEDGEVEEVDSTQVAGEIESGGEVAATVTRKPKAPRSSNQALKRRQSTMSVNARESRKTSVLERNVKRQRVSRTSAKTAASISPENALTELDQEEHSSSFRGISAEQQANVATSADMVSDSEEEILPPVAEEYVLDMITVFLLICFLLTSNSPNFSF